MGRRTLFSLFSAGFIFVGGGTALGEVNFAPASRVANLGARIQGARGASNMALADRLDARSQEAKANGRPDAADFYERLSLRFNERAIANYEQAISFQNAANQNGAFAVQYEACGGSCAGLVEPATIAPSQSPSIPAPSGPQVVSRLERMKAAIPRRYRR